MTDPLRTLCIEAMARAYLIADEGPFPYLKDEHWPEWWIEGQEDYGPPFAAALDALLDCLTQHADDCRLNDGHHPKGSPWCAHRGFYPLVLALRENTR